MNDDHDYYIIRREDRPTEVHIQTQDGTLVRYRSKPGGGVDEVAAYADVRPILGDSIGWALRTPRR